MVFLMADTCNTRRHDAEKKGRTNCAAHSVDSVFPRFSIARPMEPNLRLPQWVGKAERLLDRKYDDNDNDNDNGK